MSLARKFSAQVNSNLSIPCHSVANEPLVILWHVGFCYIDRLVHETVAGDLVGHRQRLLLGQLLPEAQVGRFLVQIKNFLKIDDTV